MSVITLEVMTPDRMVLKAEVVSLRIQLADGWWGILPGHAPFIAMLPVGVMTYREGTARHYLALAGGTMEVQGDRVVILTAAAEWADGIAAMEKALAARRAEDERIAFQARIEFERARAALLRALTEEGIAR